MNLEVLCRWALLLLLCQLLPCFPAESSVEESEEQKGRHHMRRQEDVSSSFTVDSPEEAAARAAQSVSTADHLLGKSADNIAADTAAAAAKVAAEKAKQENRSDDAIVEAATDGAIAAAKAANASEEVVTLLAASAAAKTKAGLLQQRNRTVQAIASAAGQVAAKVAQRRNFTAENYIHSAIAEAGKAAAAATSNGGGSAEEVLQAANAASRAIAELLSLERSPAPCVQPNHTGASAVLASRSAGVTPAQSVREGIKAAAASASVAGASPLEVAKVAASVGSTTGDLSADENAEEAAGVAARSAEENQTDTLSPEAAAQQAAISQGASPSRALAASAREAATIASDEAKSNNVSETEIRDAAYKTAYDISAAGGLSSDAATQEATAAGREAMTSIVLKKQHGGVSGSTIVATDGLDQNAAEKDGMHLKSGLAEVSFAKSDSQKISVSSSQNSNAFGGSASLSAMHLVPDQYACAYLCQAHVALGCCSFLNETVDALAGTTNVSNAGGYCMFSPGPCTLENASGGWISASCEAENQTAKCSNWTAGRCANGSNASLALPVWELVWEDDFDTTTCKRDGAGIYRPNPDFWTPEIGYKRGKEQQWYQPDNAECKNGELVIAAKRQRDSTEASKATPCKLKNWDNSPPNYVLSDADCAPCGPPQFKYDGACALLQNDGSGAPACDCSQGAEFTSAALISRGKKEFSYGLFEIKAKVNSRSGLWPSWWAVGDFDYVPWPKNGEIDILDMFQRVAKAAVFHANETGLPSGAIQHSAARLVDDTWEDYYHIWQLEWDEDKITIRIDTEDILELQLSVADPIRTSWPNPFTNDKKFFMILNLAVGGLSGGDTSDTSFPGEFIVDYIRVYNKTGMTPR